MTIKALQVLDQETINRLSALGEARSKSRKNTYGRIRENRLVNDLVEELDDHNFDYIWPDNQNHEVE